MPLSIRTSTGLSIYALFQGTDIAVAGTEGTVLDAGWYVFSDDDIEAEALPAGTYSGAFLEGSAAAPSASDPEHGIFTDFSWTGSEQSPTLPDAITDMLSRLETLLPVTPDIGRTWIARRGVQSKIISKSTNEAPRFWVDISQLLAGNAVITAASNITATGCTVTGTSFTGNYIYATIAGGTVSNTPIDVVVSFNTSAGGAPIVTRCRLRITE